MNTKTFAATAFLLTAAVSVHSCKTGGNNITSFVEEQQKIRQEAVSNALSGAPAPK